MRHRPGDAINQNGVFLFMLWNGPPASPHTPFSSFRASFALFTSLRKPSPDPGLEPTKRAGAPHRTQFPASDRTAHYPTFVEERGTLAKTRRRKENRVSMADCFCVLPLRLCAFARLLHFLLTIAGAGIFEVRVPPARRVLHGGSPTF